MQTEDMPKKRKKNRSALKKAAIVLLWLAAIAAVVFLVLFIASRIGQFDSIGAMLNYIWAQF